MSDFVIDQATLFQEASTIIPNDLLAALRPFIAGGHAALFRYAQAAEKPLALLGGYNPFADTVYQWPNQPANSLVDLSYAQIYLDNACLQYFSDPIGSGDVWAPVAGYLNRVRANSTVVKASTGVSRSGSFYSRDVAIGDAITVANNSVLLSTTVAGFAAETAAASVAAATADTHNAASQSASTTVSQTAGTVNDVTVTASGAAYDGLRSGVISETYVIAVVSGVTAAGDATTATINVTSSSAKDSVSGVHPRPYGVPTPIGTRGATLTFKHGTTDLVTGQTWTLSINQVFTSPTPTSGGTFAGPKNVTYAIAVTQGGMLGAPALLVPPTVAASVSPTGGGSTALANPTTAATVNPTGGGSTGGGLAAGVYFVAYTFVNSAGETTAGTSEATFTAAAGNKPVVTVPSLPSGASSINLYLTQPGGSSGSEVLYATGITTTTVTLLTANTGTQTLPGSNTTGGNLPAGTYYLSYTWLTDQGESTSGASETTFTSASGNIPRATIPALPIGARGANIYLSQASGTSGSEHLYRQNVTTTTVDLTASTYNGQAYSASASLPASNTATPPVPQISAVATDGSDSSGPVTITGSGVAVPVGSYGATVAFAGGQLRKGDLFYVACTAAAAGAIQTIILNTNLPAGLLSASDLTITLSIVKNGVLINPNKIESPPNVNYIATTNNLTVKAAITAYDPSWNNNGVGLPLLVTQGTLYAQYRAWLSTYAGQVANITLADVTQLVPTINASLGVYDPDNPLGYAVGKALLNSNGQPVRFTAVASPTTQSQWSDVLAMITGLSNIYGLVPLTHDPVVLAAWQAHVIAQSTAAVGCYRRLWIAGQLTTPVPIVTSANTTDSANAQGTLANNPAVPGTHYTLFSLTTGNAKFVTSGVQPGDTLRYLYAVDPFGNLSWTEFPIASVVNEQQLILATGNSVAVTLTQRFEIWRSLTANQLAASLAATSAAVSNRTVSYVIPDKLGDSGTTVDGYYLCAALAAYSGAVAPHQALRYASMSGFDDYSRTTKYLNNGHLNTLEAAGVFIATQDDDNTPYIRAALTSDTSSVANEQEAAVRSLDAVKLFFKARVKKYLGRSNITDYAIAQIRTELVGAGEYCRNKTSINRLGTLVTSTTVGNISQDPAGPDRLLAAVTVTTPYQLDGVTFNVTSGS